MVSAGLAFYYFRHYKTETIRKEHLLIRKKYIGRIASLGAAPCSNQLAMMIVQIIMNKSITYYGALSSYGESIPLACVGIITKVNQVFFSFIIGISQGLQPIVSFNYGAKNYLRVKSAYLRAVSYGFGIAMIAFLMFQILPRQIISMFGNGSDVYYKFGVSYFRIFLLFTFLNFLQPITSNFFTAIGKPQKGILYAGPVADFIAGMISAIMILKELKNT